MNPAGDSPPPSPPAGVRAQKTSACAVRVSSGASRCSARPGGRLNGTPAGVALKQKPRRGGAELMYRYCCSFDLSALPVLHHESGNCPLTLGFVIIARAGSCMVPRRAPFAMTVSMRSPPRPLHLRSIFPKRRVLSHSCALAISSACGDEMRQDRRGRGRAMRAWRVRGPRYRRS